MASYDASDDCINQQTEIREAIEAADEALDRLREAESHLDRAHGWGLADMVGGGMFMSFIKHHHIDEARGELEAANEAVRRFASELADVEGMSSLGVDVSSFLSFADVFLDNFVIDIVVQQQVDEARDGVEEAIARIEKIRSELGRRLSDTW